MALLRPSQAPHGKRLLLSLSLLAVVAAAGAGCSAQVETGSLSVRLNYGDNTAGRSSPLAVPGAAPRSAYVHSDNNVIVIRVLAPHIAAPMEGTFRRSAGHGEITGVPAGDRLVVEVDEFDASGTSLLARGWTQGVSLSPGQRRDVTVTMYARGDIVRVCGADNTLGPGGDAGETGDGGLAINAKLGQPLAVKVASDDSIYVSSSFNNNHRIRKIDRYGYISHVAGAGQHGVFTDNQDAATSPLGEIFDIDFDPEGNLYLINWWQEIVKVDSVTGKVFIKYGGQPFNSLAKPDIAVADNDTVFYSNGIDDRIYHVQGGIRNSFVDNVNGSTSGDIADQHSYSSRYPSSVSFLRSGPSLFIADRGNGKIKAVLFILGNQVRTFVGDNAATLFFEGAGRLQMSPLFPLSFDVDDIFGNYFFRERDHHGMRVVRPDGNVYNFAGNGAIGYSGDGGPAIGARLYDPRAVAVDSRGNVYIADTGNNVLRVVIGGALP